MAKVKGRIHEIFDSIQGEGLFFGEKQIFVRFFGCNLSCRYCDTRMEHYEELEPQELANRLRTFHDEYHSVSFTGGEPLMQKDFLKEALYYSSCYGFKNYLETNGVLARELADVIDNVDVVAMDLKLPSSIGFNEKYWIEHHTFLKVASQKQVFVKSVVCKDTTKDDLNTALDLINVTDKSIVFVLQPDSNEEQGALYEKLHDFKKACSNRGVTSCVIEQIHKKVGVK